MSENWHEFSKERTAVLEASDILVRIQTDSQQRLNTRGARCLLGIPHADGFVVAAAALKGPLSLSGIGMHVTSAGFCPAFLSSLVPVSSPAVFYSCPCLSCHLCLPLHDPFLLSVLVRVNPMFSLRLFKFASGVWAVPPFSTDTYLLIHSGGGSISAAGSCPASFRPLPAKRLMTRIVMS
jgi:hypothetical protein